MKTSLNIILVLTTAWIQVSYSQTDTPPLECDKYCFKDCSEYLLPLFGYHPEGGRKIWVPSLGMGVFYHTQDTQEYSKCIAANRNCHCEYQISKNNPLLWLAISGFGVVCVLCIYCICRKYKFYRIGKLMSTRSSSVHPNVIVPSPSMATISSTTSSNAPFSNWYTEGDVSEAPPDYIPPPQYHDVVSRRNSKGNSKPQRNENESSKSEDVIFSKSKTFKQ